MPTPIQTTTQHRMPPRREAGFQGKKSSWQFGSVQVSRLRNRGFNERWGASICWMTRMFSPWGRSNQPSQHFALVGRVFLYVEAEAVVGHIEDLPEFRGWRGDLLSRRRPSWLCMASRRGVFLQGVRSWFSSGHCLWTGVLASQRHR